MADEDYKPHPYGPTGEAAERAMRLALIDNPAPAEREQFGKDVAFLIT